MSIARTGLEGLTGDLAQVRRRVRAAGRRHRQRPASRRRNLAGWSLLALVLLLLVGAAAAFADPGGGTDPAMDAVALKDSHGLTPGQYDLVGLDTGGVTSADTSIAWFLVWLGWLLYRFLVGLAVWFINQAWGFKWLDMLRPPAEAVADALNSVTGDLGLVPLLLTVSVLVTGVWMFRGRYAAGIGELLISLVIGALATTVLANPVGLVAGPDGALVKSKQLGVSTAWQVLHGGPGRAVAAPMHDPTAIGRGPGQAGAGPAARARVGTAPVSDRQMEQDTTSALLDVFIRQPWQILTYGSVVDGKKPAQCTKAVDDQLKGKRTTAPGTGLDPRLGGSLDSLDNPAQHQKEIRAYDKAQELQKTCGVLTPGSDTVDPKSKLLSVVVIAPAGLALVGFALALALVLLALCAITLWEAAKAIIELLKAIIPGSSRAGLFSSFCTVLVCLAFIVAALLSLAVFTLVVKNVFAADSALNPILAFFLVDLVVTGAIVAVLILALKAKGHGRRAGEGLTKALSPRPTTMPERSSAAGGLVRSGIRMGTGLGGAMMLNRKLGAGGASSPTAPSPPPKAGDAARSSTSRVRKLGGVAKTSGTVAAKGTGLALKGTVGAPVYVPRATRAAKESMAARRVALQTKLAAGKQRAHARVDQVKDFGREYAHNTATAGRFVSKVSGASHLAVGGAHLAAGAFTAAAPHLAAGALASKMLFSPKKANPLPPVAAQRPARLPVSAGRFSKRAVTPPPSPQRSPASRPPAPSQAPARRVSPAQLPRLAQPVAQPAAATSASETSRLRLLRRLEREKAAGRRPRPTTIR